MAGFFRGATCAEGHVGQYANPALAQKNPADY